MFIFPSHAVIGAKKVARYFWVAALFFIGWDLYVWLVHGHIIGGVFLAGICLLLAWAAFAFKGQVVVSAKSYRAEYVFACIPFKFEYAFATYKVLRVEYDCFYSRQAQRHPKVLQFFLLPNASSKTAFGVSLLADIYFDKTQKPEEVVDFIRRFIEVSGLELILGDGPFEHIKALFDAQTEVG